MGLDPGYREYCVKGVEDRVKGGEGELLTSSREDVTDMHSREDVGKL